MSNNKKILKVGTISKEKIYTMDRAISRQEEIDEDRHKGFKSRHSIHRSKKTYTRKKKHRGREF